MDKAQLKELLKEMFKDGEIEIKVDAEKLVCGLCLVTEISIDNEIVYENRQFLIDDSWK